MEGQTRPVPGTTGVPPATGVPSQTVRTGGDGSRIEGLAARAAPVVGPLVIVVAVLVVLHDFAFLGQVSAQHPDILPFWLPTHCLMGRSLAAGSIPLWNAYTVAGVPFAADPQSGWMNLPAMLLYSAVPCAAAVRWFLVLNPILAGLGLYAFLRIERLPRAAATTGGLALALMITNASFVLEIPFAGTMAWTSILLAAVAGLVRAGTWAARLAWSAGVAVAWGQVAASHLSHGLVVATIGAGLYLAMRLVSDVRAGRRGWAEALILVGLVVTALPLVNLALLLPRLAYLPRTTLALGYRALEGLANEAAGGPSPSPGAVAPGPPESGGLAVGWPLQLMRSPGANIGAAAAALWFAALATRRHLTLVASTMAFGVACYVLSLTATAEAVGRVAQTWPFVDVYLHAPGRFRYGTVLAVAVMAGLGVAAWPHVRPRWRVVSAGAGIVVWWILPLVTGLADVRVPLLLVCSLALGTVAVTVVLLRPRWIWLVPMLVAVDLVANGLAGRSVGVPVADPPVDAAAYTRPGSIALAIHEGGGGRMLRLAPGVRRADLIADPENWPLLANQRSVLFGLEDVSGYNPIQLPRYWSFVRAVNPNLLKYNAASFARPPPDELAVVVDLLAVRWIITGTGVDPGVPAEPVVSEGRWQLHEVIDPAPMISLFNGWATAGSDAVALARVLGPGFDPRIDLVVEGGAAQSGAGSALASDIVTQSWDPAAARLVAEVRSSAAGMLLVRIPFEENWRASVDGVPAELLHANHLLMAVPIPPGSHTVSLAYRDPSIAGGLAGTGVALAALLGTAAWLGRVRRRRDGVRGRPVGLRRSPRAPRAVRLPAPGS